MLQLHRFGAPLLGGLGSSPWKPRSRYFAVRALHHMLVLLFREENPEQNASVFRTNYSSWGAKCVC